MASKQSEVAFQCSGCQKELDLESKTLPCLHSFCRSCLDNHFKGKTKGNGQCPECHETLRLDRLSLSPFLVKSLRRRQLESTDWKCDFCSEDGIESTARYWCQDCRKLCCATCSRIHKKHQPKHNSRDLDVMERGEVIKAVTTDMCSLHQKINDSYCERCNVCLCDTCYQNHLSESLGCSSRPLSVREEALKQRSQGPTLAEEMDDLERRIRRVNERAMKYTKELDSDCNSKCAKLWQDIEDMWENTKQKTHELCDEMRQLTDEQMEKWHLLLEENDLILKQLEIWRVNLRHLLSEAQQDVDVVCGLRSIGSKLSSRLHQSVGPYEKCQLGVTLNNWWLQVRDQLKRDKIGSVSLTREQEIDAHNLVFYKQWNLNRSDSDIRSIHVSEEDDHVFLCDFEKQSIIEFTESGELVSECDLFDGTNRFEPFDMCSISADVFVVVCGLEKKLFFLERRKIPPFLKIKKIIDTENKFISVCQTKETIFACDRDFQIVSFTKEGKRIQTIKPGESGGGRWPRIRADPSTGNLWGARFGSCEIFCFDRKGQKLRSLKTEEKIHDFRVNEFCGFFYFSNFEGIFSFSPKKVVYKFEKESQRSPKFFVLKKKMFVYLQIDEKRLIKIFKILD